ncbi:YdgA family protein [Pseudomonas sp. DWP3-1-2]|uniref:YdgA family protein n=1 Tax=Pseudomonas sp. DWP3-1-2 TaxID=2804645 RepID=UPI003CF4CAE9
MNKSAGIAVGVIVVIGALATGGAWYTGTRLEGVLRDSIQNANLELANSLKGSNSSMTIELASMDRHLFSSTAHYRVVIQDPNLTADGTNAEFLFVDHIEHGPFPVSRITSLKLLPVMAQSNFEMEKSPSAEKWFAMSKGVAPVKGYASVGYDRAVSGALNLSPLEMNDTDGTFTFSGLNMDVDASADAEKVNFAGNMDNLKLDVTGPDGQVMLAVQGLTFDSGGTKGKSGFYLGHSNLKIASALAQVAGQPPILFKDVVNTNLAQEDEGKFAAQVNYNVGMINFQGNDLGAAQMAFKVSNFDVAATQALYQLYETKILPQQQAAAAAGEPLQLALLPADQQLMEAQMSRLLAGKPHVEFEKLALKTTNGESHVRIAVDLKDPGSLDQPSSAVLAKSIGQLDAKVVLSKPMIQDIATLQAKAAGLTDAAAIETQAKSASDMIATLAVALQLAKAEGENVVTDLHYANDVVDFNGQKMSPQQFVALIMGKVGGISGQ